MEKQQAPMQPHKHVAWISKESGVAFFNPANMWKTEVPGEERSGHIVVAVGSIEQMQAVVSSINATMPPVGNLFDDLA